MNKYILSICIASYNRRDILVPDVKKYLSLNDNRFVVTVQDDGSTDGTYEELQGINDPRLILRRNETNLGGLQNAKAALDNHKEALYVLNLNDKDYINVDLLSPFIDYLESKEPYYGFVDFLSKDPIHIERFEKGLDSIRKLSYQCVHPSGYFWRTELYHEEINCDYYNKLPPKFDYQFDLMFAHCAVRFPGDIVYMPLITYFYDRKELSGCKSYSYTENNLYFFTPKRLETYCLFLDDINILETDNNTKSIVQYSVTERTLMFVTSLLRSFLHNDVVCDHYNLRSRSLSFFEIESNIISVLRIYSRYILLYKIKFAAYKIIMNLLIHHTVVNFKASLKEFLRR